MFLNKKPKLISQDKKIKATPDTTNSGVSIHGVAPLAPELYSNSGSFPLTHAFRYMVPAIFRCFAGFCD